ncbi:MAG: hypothetical protein EPO00_13370 [Chloroflexota bacterium]|nr:MAG: hypothetical protein EPO00_13370 [Chloroflexota bacterium]
MAQPSVFTAQEKAKEARREVSMRCAVYPKWIAAGRMKQVDADRRIAIMTAIAVDYERRAQPELL